MKKSARRQKKGTRRVIDSDDDEEEETQSKPKEEEVAMETEDGDTAQNTGNDIEDSENCVVVEKTEEKSVRM